MDRFVTKFCEWATTMGYPRDVRRALPSALRRFPDFVAKCDAYRDVVLRIVPRPGDLRLLELGPVCWGYTSGSKLLLGAVSPSWRGVRSYYKNSAASEVVDSFAHLAAQYILRSRIVRVQAALALTYGIVCDFRDADLVRMTVGPDSREDLKTIRIKVAKPDLRARSRATRAREFHAWVTSLNPLDPFIHRALFQYWRACALIEHGFWEEAITAFDGVVAVAAEALHRRQGLPNQPTRPETAAIVGMGEEDQRLIENIYQLRCAFGAHPPPSKWWDFSELYDGELDQYPELARRFLHCFSDHEGAHRYVEADPSAWADWFAQNAEMLLEVAWFTKLPA